MISSIHVLCFNVSHLAPGSILKMSGANCVWSQWIRSLIVFADPQMMNGIVLLWRFCEKMSPMVFFNLAWNHSRSFQDDWYAGNYSKTSNISCILVGSKIFDYSDVVGASPVALLQLHLHFRLNTWLQWIGQRQLQDEMRTFKFLPEASFGLRVLSLPGSVCPSVSLSVTKFVSVIIHYLFKLGWITNFEPEM